MIHVFKDMITNKFVPISKYDITELVYVNKYQTFIYYVYTNSKNIVESRKVLVNRSIYEIKNIYN